MPNLSPLPRETPITARLVDPQTGRMSLTGMLANPWDNWLSEVAARLDDTGEALVSTSLTGQSAAILTTSFALSSLAPGLYRVSYYARITQAATTSSSLTVTIGHTDGGVSCAQSGAALTGNTTATVQSGTLIVRIDSATAITYATAYASVGATPMQYRTDFLVEQL